MTDKEERRPIDPDGAPRKDTASLPAHTAEDLAQPLVSYRFEALRGRLGQFAARMIEEALLDALPATWERRARDFDAVPLPDVAEACRAKATLLRRYPEMSAQGMVEATRDALEEVGVLA